MPHSFKLFVASNGIYLIN